MDMLGQNLDQTARLGTRLETMLAAGLVDTLSYGIGYTKVGARLRQAEDKAKHQELGYVLGYGLGQAEGYAKGYAMS